MSLLTSVRSVVLGFVVLFAVLALCLNASLLAFSSFNGDGDDDDHSDLRHKIANFVGTGVGIAALTILIVSPVMVMNFLRQRSAAALVLLEIGWVSILMILWVTAAGQASSAGIFSDGCSNADDDVQSLCMQYQALQGFEWLQFIILLLWLAVVMVIAAMAHFRGHTRVWLYPFCDAVVLCRSPPQRSSSNGLESKAVFTQNGLTSTDLRQPQHVPALNVNTVVPRTASQTYPSPTSPTAVYHHTPTSASTQPPRYPSPVSRVRPPPLFPGDLSHPSSQRRSVDHSNSNRAHAQGPVDAFIPPSELPPAPQPHHRPLSYQSSVPPSLPSYRPLPPQPTYKPLTQDEISKLPQV